MRSRFAGVAIAVIVTAAAAPSFAQQQPHNVILFIADGLRPGMVNEQTAPALAGLMQQGVHFTNTHAMFQRQNDLGGRVDEIGLLDGVGDEGAGGLKIAGLAVLAARRRLHVESRRLEPLLHLGAERNAAGASGRVVDDDGLLAIALGVIEDECRPELADGGGAHAGRAGGAHDRLLIEIIAGEMLVDVAKHRIAFQERGKAVAGAWHGKSGIERVAESPGVADLVPRRHRRGIGHGEAVWVGRKGDSQFDFSRGNGGEQASNGDQYEATIHNDFNNVKPRN